MFLHFKGLFRNIVIRSEALVTKKLWAFLYYFFTDPTFFSPVPYPARTKHYRRGAPDAPPPACLRLMQGHLNCYQFFRTFRTFARRPLSRRTRIWSSIQQRILFSIYIWINVIHERYLFI